MAKVESRRRALVGKHPSRPGVQARRGKIQKPASLAKYRHKPNHVPPQKFNKRAISLSSERDSEREAGNWRDKTPRTASNYSTPLTSPDEPPYNAPPKTPNLRLTFRPGVPKNSGKPQQKSSRAQLSGLTPRSKYRAPTVNLSPPTPNTPISLISGNEDDEPAVNHVPQQSHRPGMKGNAHNAHHVRSLGMSGTQGDPIAIDSDIEELPHPGLRKNRPYFPSQKMRELNQIEKELPSPQRTPGRSIYCKPTSRKPGVRDLQGFISDNESDKASAESFDEMEVDPDGHENMDVDPDDIAKELINLDVDMYGWAAHTHIPNAREHIKKEVDEEARVVSSSSKRYKPRPQHRDAFYKKASNTQAGKVPVGSRKPSRYSTYTELDTRLTDDEEDFKVLASPPTGCKEAQQNPFQPCRDEYGRFVSTSAANNHIPMRPKVPVKPSRDASIKSAQLIPSQSTSNKASMSHGTSPSLSPTPELAELIDWNRQRDVLNLSIEASDRDSRAEKKKKWLFGLF